MQRLRPHPLSRIPHDLERPLDQVVDDSPLGRCPPMKLTIHIDGGARGNPGPAGAGVSMRDARRGIVFEAGFYLGEMTNNQAEYGALLKALEVAERIGAAAVTVFADSELLVRQINGDYRVKNAGLKPLFGKATERLGRFGDWRVHHVLRESNSRADELANMAMDARRDVIVRDVDDNDGAYESDDTPDPDKAESVVIVRCIEPPNPSACPAPCRVGATYRIHKTVPAGLCADAAAVIVKAAVEMRTQRCQTNVTCLRSGCGARFQMGAG